MTRVMGVIADLVYLACVTLQQTYKRIKDSSNSIGDIAYRAYHDTGIDARVCRVVGCKPRDCGWPWVRCSRCHDVWTEMR